MLFGASHQLIFFARQGIRHRSAGVPPAFLVTRQYLFHNRAFGGEPPVDNLSPAKNKAPASGRDVRAPGARASRPLFWSHANTCFVTVLLGASRQLIFFARQGIRHRPADETSALLERGRPARLPTPYTICSGTRSSLEIRRIEYSSESLNSCNSGEPRRHSIHIEGESRRLIAIRLRLTLSEPERWCRFLARIKF